MSGDSEMYVGQTVTYSIPKVARASSYRWNLDFNCNDVEDQNSGSYIPWQIISGQGSNTIKVKAGSSCLGVISCTPKSYCGTGAMIYKYVESKSSSGGGGGGGDDWDGDNCYNSFSINTYPNPSDGRAIVCRIEYEDPCDDNNDLKRISGKNLAEIFDMKGRKKYSKSFNQKEFRINGLKLAKGMYVLHITLSNGTKSRKLIVIK